MAKRKNLTNKDGYQAVMEALRAKGHKFPKAALAKMLGFVRQAVDNWGGEVPPAHAFRVSLLSGVPIEQILPETIEEVRTQTEDGKH